MKFTFRIILLAMLWACHAPQKSTSSHNTPHPSQPAKPADVPVIVARDNIAWLDSERLMPVLEKAQRENKAVFMEFHASWCAPCKVMEEEVFTQPQVYEYLNQRFLCFRTDFDSDAGKTLADIYEVEKLPTVLFLDPKGVVLERYLGILNPSTLKTLGASALGKMGK